MHLKDYLNTIKKEGCPQNCELKSKKETEIALVPPPDEILGLLISRDPTTDWLDTYRKNRKNREALFSAIPELLIKRIKKFTGEDINCVSELLYKNVYWTHLHKCFTDKSEKKSIKFEPKNAIQCADKWLAQELDIAINDRTKFIIALGNDVQKWICEWREDYCQSKNIKIIYLPHPSLANVGRYFSWYPNEQKDKEILKKRINILLKLCKTVA